MVFSDWQSAVVYSAAQAGCCCDADIFSAQLEKAHYSLARARTRAKGPFETGRTYSFSCEIEMDEGVRCQLAYTWLDREEKPIFRAHAVPHGTVTAPKGAQTLELDVCFFGFSGGTEKYTILN